MCCPCDPDRDPLEDLNAYVDYWEHLQVRVNELDRENQTLKKQLASAPASALTKAWATAVTKEQA